jgi:ferric-dicitrate binding protein FerR (iron transport regulator)
MTVKVLGTKFNLSAYKDDETIEVTLVEGSLEMDASGRKMLLEPGETGTYDKIDSVLYQVDKTAAYACGWTNDKIYMNDMPLSALCKRLERMYDVHITLHGVGETIRYNGVVAEESITDVLGALGKLSNIKYNMREKNINITYNNNAYGKVTKNHVKKAGKDSNTSRNISPLKNK